jgi:hypothetical protein
MADSGFLELQNGTAPGTPSSTFTRIYVDEADDLVKAKSDDGTVRVLEAPATTDDLPEGITNLYFTDERAQDAVGTALANTTSIDLSYNDGTNEITADLNDSGVTPGAYGTDTDSATLSINSEGRVVIASNTPINHDLLLNFVANEHVDHSSVNINTSANSGLAGGGDITASRSLSVNVDNLTLATERLVGEDEIPLYSSSASTTKKYLLRDFLSKRGRTQDLANYISADFVINESFLLSQVGSGAGNSTQQGAYGMDTVERALGISETDTGTNAAGRRTVSSSTSGLTTGLARLRFGARHALNQLSNPFDVFVVTLGFINITTSGADHNAGAYFSYSSTVNGGRWEAVTASGGGAPTRTRVDTGILADTLYNIFEVEIAEDSSQALFYINDTLVATISTNIPPTSTVANFTFGFGWKIEKFFGTTSVAHSTDWFYFEQERSTAR